MTSSPVWSWLNEPGGTHWRTLKRDYLPEGLLELITAPPELVLDVGCFCGAVGARLKEKYPGVRVVGVEPIKEAAEVARQKLDMVITGKLEEVDLPAEGVALGSVDAIILADVLEHMYNPWHALVSLRPLLAPNGVVLASIPNIRNLNVLNELVQGDFAYSGAGILDITHIRFFSYQGVQRLFAETGYKIELVEYNLDPQFQPLLERFKQSPIINLDSPVMQIKNVSQEQLRELATVQFWLRAIPL